MSSASSPAVFMPRTLWVELTSKCPADCVFCSRKLRRGAGEHLPFRLFEALVNDLAFPQRFILNYSGESTLYPDLLPAVRLARSTGAFVELVSVLTTVPEPALESLARSGLNRLTISVHVTDSSKYSSIYRYSSFEALQSRLEALIRICASLSEPPVIDLAFVAMDSNLDQLASVAALGARLGIAEITVFPLLRRDEIALSGSREFAMAGSYSETFSKRFNAALAEARNLQPEVKLTISGVSIERTRQCVGEVPMPCPGPLPEGAFIHSCEQNPWETVHVLSNGDVVVCEVLDKTPVGNLHKQRIGEIWHGDAYTRFRQAYRTGGIPECRACPWKTAYHPVALTSDIIASRGRHAQLLHGWHEPDGEPHLWSGPQASAVLKPRRNANTLHVSGVLPPNLRAESNTLTVSVNGAEVGAVVNESGDNLSFGVDLPVSLGTDEQWSIDFRVTQPYRRLGSREQRTLGFALRLLSAKSVQTPAAVRSNISSLQKLARWIGRVDRFGGMLRKSAPPTLPTTIRREMTILIPERDSVNDLRVCLSAFRVAAAQCSAVSGVVVVVNGAARSLYADLVTVYPEVTFLYHTEPLGFSSAIAKGLQQVRTDWVYLLNSDVALEADALSKLRDEMGPDVFSIGSQIFLSDATRFREETNLGAVLIEEGLATIHDLIPTSEETVPSFYVGGGASLFQTSALWRLLERDCYSPFYWEDVEWGWRARRLGYRSRFCASSRVVHRQRATISKFYSEADVEHIQKRNGLLFQFRNFLTTGSVERAIEEIARSGDAMKKYFTDHRTLWTVAKGRLWNHRYSKSSSDEELLACTTVSERRPAR